MGNVPNLRFPEFSGEWENCQIANILSMVVGGITNILKKGNIPSIWNSMVYMSSKGVSTMVDVVCDSLPYIKEESMPKPFTLFKEGDVDLLMRLKTQTMWLKP